MRRLLLAVFLLAGCAHKVPVRPAHIEDHGSWSVREENGITYVWVYDGAAEKAMRDDYCNPVQYVCRTAPGGRILIVERNRK